MTDQPIISLENVGVRYKRVGNVFRRKKYFDALKDVTLDIYPGETLGVLGRNGAGKSTLLKVIAGLIRPDSGRVINRGVSVSLLALQAGFDPNLSGRDNAVISAMLQGASRKEAESRLGEIQDYAELGEFFDEPIRTYSTGMRARLGFAVSTIIDPDVLLLDEVLSVGDQQFKEKARRTMMEKLSSEQTVILVSHSQEHIKTFCSRAILLDKHESIIKCTHFETLSSY